MTLEKNAIEQMPRRMTEYILWMLLSTFKSLVISSSQLVRGSLETNQQDEKGARG